MISLKSINIITSLFLLYPYADFNEMLITSNIPFLQCDNIVLAHLMCVLIVDDHSGSNRPGENMLLSTDTDEDRHQWILAIKQAMFTEKGGGTYYVVSYH